MKILRNDKEKNMANMETNVNKDVTSNVEPEKYMQVSVSFLQAILDYLKTKPYEEVHTFIDILTGKEVPFKNEEKK